MNLNENVVLLLINSALNWTITWHWTRNKPLSHTILADLNDENIGITVVMKWLTYWRISQVKDKNDRSIPENGIQWHHKFFFLSHATWHICKKNKWKLSSLLFLRISFIIYNYHVLFTHIKRLTHLLLQMSTMIFHSLWPIDLGQRSLRWWLVA